MKKIRRNGGIILLGHWYLLVLLSLPMFFGHIYITVGIKGKLERGRLQIKGYVNISLYYNYIYIIINYSQLYYSFDIHKY